MRATLRSAARWARRSAVGALALASAMAFGGGCQVEKGGLGTDTFRLRVGLTLQDGSPLPGPDAPLCLDLRGTNPSCPKGQFFSLSVDAINPDGTLDTGFNRYVRVSILPGTVVSVTSPPEGTGVGRAEGRNVLLVNGHAEGQIVHVVGAFGPSRLLVEDIGYQPGDPTNAARLPLCADGLDNDGDGLTDFPADPGCAFSNDDTEDGGTFATGASTAINFSLPTIAEAQGFGAGTPFAQEGIQVETAPPRSELVVSRISNGGFYVVDVETITVPESPCQANSDCPEGGLCNKEAGTCAPEIYRARPFGSLFVFNFSLPPGVLVCDRVTYLTGTMDEGFGDTEMVFPSFEVEPFDTRPEAKTPNKRCRLPEPRELGPDDASNNAVLEQVEAGLVRVRGAHVGAHFGSAFPEAKEFDLGPNHPCQGNKRYVFGPGASNCDFDRSGRLTFTEGSDEALCACFCYRDPECSEWSNFRGRGSFRLVLGPTAAQIEQTPGLKAATPQQTIQVNTSVINTFDPPSHSGKVIRSVTGTAANFSGGDLNWTIEARCPDDLVLCTDDSGAVLDLCTDEPPAGLSSQQACIGKRTASDNDDASAN